MQPKGKRPAKNDQQQRQGAQETKGAQGKSTKPTKIPSQEEHPKRGNTDVRASKNGGRRKGTVKKEQIQRRGKVIQRRKDAAIRPRQQDPSPKAGEARPTSTCKKHQGARSRTIQPKTRKRRRAHQRPTIAGQKKQ